MSLQPGPFLIGIPDGWPFKSGTYDFTDDAEQLGGELSVTADGWGAFIDDLANLAAGPADPTLGIDDALLLQEIANETQLATLPDLEIVFEALDTAGSLLGIALGFAPAAAFVDPTMPFVPPDPNATIVVPTIPLTAYNPTITGVVGGPAGPTLPYVQLSNLTRVGSLNFVVGDSFFVHVNGPPNQPVAVDGVLNGVDFGQNVLGTTDGNGIYSLSGVEGPDAIGSWVENWYVGGVLSQTFSFLVSPS